MRFKGRYQPYVADVGPDIHRPYGGVSSVADGKPCWPDSQKYQKRCVMILWIIMILAFIIIIALFFAILRDIFRAVASAIGLIFLVSIILGVLVFLDARDFAQNMQDSDYLFIVKSDGRLLGGIRDVFSADGAKPLTEEEFSSYSESYSEGDYAAILGSNYKIFMMDMKAFEPLKETGFAGFEGFQKDIVIDALKSDKTSEFIVDKALDEASKNMTLSKDQEDYLRESMLAKLGQESQLRATLMGILLQVYMEEKGKTFIIGGCRSGDIEVYPDSMLFITIRYLPEAVVDKAEEMLESKGAQE